MSKVKESFIKKLLREYPYQDTNLIGLCRESYKGGPAYIDGGNLFSHTREHLDDYVNRKKRAYYLNYTAPVIDTYVFFLFKAAVSRNFDKTNLTLYKFMLDVDKAMTSLDTFMKSQTLELLQAGRVWVVVDSPDFDTESKLDELELGKRPYVYTIPTEDVLDFEKDDKGLLWVKYRIYISSKEGSWDYDGKGAESRIVIWSRESYTVYKENGDLDSERTNLELSLGFVPIVEIVFNNGDPFIRDIVFINRSIFNWCSLLDELIYRQTFSWLIVPSDSSQKLAEKKIGTSWAWTFDGTSKHAPQFISPDVQQAQLIADQIKFAIQEVYRISCLDWSISQSAARSGTAKAYDFMNVNKALGSLALTLQEAEKKIFSIFAKYYNEDIDVLDDNVSSKYDVAVSYPEEFSFIAVQDRLEQLYEALTTNFSNRFKSLVANQIVDSVLPVVNADDKVAIEKEVEKAFSNDSILNSFIKDDGSEEVVDEGEADK